MSKGDFNEKTRVQVPAMVHLTRLGYEYYGKLESTDKDIKYDPETNILIQVFEEQFQKLNPDHKGDIKSVLGDIKQVLGNDDLGRSFYKKLVSANKRLIDFENPDNNVFHFTAEFTYLNENDKFRPDITLFINGLPLVFIEVKIPNNTDGIIAESDRMDDERLKNEKFRKFLNITQLMIFSNNMEYSSNGGIKRIEGAFYCTTSKDKAFFNVFREEGDFYNEFPYKEINVDAERQIFNDLNCHILHSTPEYEVNLSKTSPTNQIITSMCSKERLLFLLKYGIAYIDSTREEDGKIKRIYQKHIIRYQQMFACLAAKKRLSEGVKSGIIWHTQGSGKTALSYFLTKYLTDYYAKRNTVAKFYFIVDRLDLLEQAKQEFEARGLAVRTYNNRDKLMKHFKENHSSDGNNGRLEITVINIQLFKEDDTKIEFPAYSTQLQRIFIVDEAHRGYKPNGTFLGNLFNSDPNSVKIALTGTPLLKEETASRKVFGKYLHTYYYDKSIQDGYTLKILREDIETTYKNNLNEIYKKFLENIVIGSGEIKLSDILEHDSYVKEFTKYVIKDLQEFRHFHKDNTLGGMIICKSAEQAKKVYEFFEEIQKDHDFSLGPDAKKCLKAALIIHDFEDKNTRNIWINEFKKDMSIDVLIVYQMLLTGFDAPRLKRLYLARELKDHSLLQALTRVNRPYKDNQYGYIIDFADIRQNFDEANQAYLNELDKFNINENDEYTSIYSSIMEDKDKILADINKSKNNLFEYDLMNREKFSQDISNIDDRNKLYKLRNSLQNWIEHYNIDRSYGKDENKLLNLDIERNQLADLLKIVNARIQLKSKEVNKENIKPLLNDVLRHLTFHFKHVNKGQNDELKIISHNELWEKMNVFYQEIERNIDRDNPKFKLLIEIVEQHLENFKIKPVTPDEYMNLIKLLTSKTAEIKEINRINSNIKSKYNDDIKYLKIHNWINEEKNECKKQQKDYLSNLKNDIDIWIALKTIKNEIDEEIYNSKNIVNNDEYFESLIMSNIAKLNLSTSTSDKIKLRDKIKSQYKEQLNK
ncbi:type I restriction endonuclease subunit R [Mycoplasmopsis mucosicanis]|uniref:type I site-specific deoxyribonuclease n=1 Tax=Mycoplasmopsis mucosicanis TaxID=458208 RepID=A0A507SPP8_9BACT|nr:type I restriction endonuclease [Mycoplasmopsis mucosicanis]TQC51342.1 type I restriction endonuclease subunit R [Mycoplasmopsis mucosicanis]